MSVTKVFTDQVASGDIIGVRIMMKDSLLVDCTFKDFDEMSRLTEKMPGLYDTHDGREFVLDKEKWDDTYMNKLMVQVVSNFSHERLEHLKEVVRYLRPVPEQKQSTLSRTAGSSAHYHKTSPQRTMSYQAQKEEDERNGRVVRIVSGTAVGAVVGGVGAAVVGATTGTVVVCAAAGAAVGGVIIAATAKGV